MKKSTKPISSPGRTEKFPPPLMRFLRSNVGSKSSSRGRRSRASPMFSWKKNTVIETTQEPSSPKVTCIGQVRVRRSKKNKKTTTTTTKTSLRHHPSSRLCRCLKKIRPRSCLAVLRKWVSCFRCGYCKKSRNLHDSPVIEGSPGSVIAGDNVEEEKEKDKEVDQVTAEKEGDNHGLISRSPPRNAFLLTRCRSAPYRSSSLAGKFWESLAEKTGDVYEDVAENVKNLRIKEDEEEEEEKGEVIGNENEEGTCNKSNGVEELKGVRASPSPLILTRCKSEPARTWDQLLV